MVKNIPNTISMAKVITNYSSQNSGDNHKIYFRNSIKKIPLRPKTGSFTLGPTKQLNDKILKSKDV